MDDLNIETVVRNIAQIAPMLHTAGAISPRAIKAIYEYSKTTKIRCSIETGSGATTLLMSHLSEQHFVFAKDNGSGSIENVKRSPLLNAATVQFVEGPTQKTLPAFTIPQPVQFALIDGPHAYPFPDLEYYYIYQSLSPGALLVIDDIHIKTINNLFSFLKSDAMFRLDQVLGTTAFFVRTEAPMFCPLADGWQSQLYNRRVLRKFDLLRQAWQMLPLKARKSLKFLAREFTARSRIWIDSPKHGAMVKHAAVLSGRARGPLDGLFLWVLIRSENEESWWPQEATKMNFQDGAWECNVEFGDPQKSGGNFEIAAVLVNSAVDEYLRKWRADAAIHLAAPISNFPFRSASVADTYRSVRRS